MCDYNRTSVGRAAESMFRLVVRSPDL